MLEGPPGKAEISIRGLLRSPNSCFLLFPVSLCSTKAVLSLESLEVFLLLRVILVQVTRLEA